MRQIEHELDELYAALKRRQLVASARKLVAAIYPKIHAEGGTATLRLAKNRYKKLQDEIRPALIYAAIELPPCADIEFHLSDRGPDATAWRSSSSVGIPIEVTVALGKVRYHQMLALNTTGVGHGFTNASDDDSAARIKRRYEDHRAYSTEEAVKVIAAGIGRCVGRKRHLSRTVIIDAPLNVLPARHWPDAMTEIAHELPQSRCQAIFVVGNNDDRDSCYRLK